MLGPELVDLTPKILDGTGTVQHRIGDRRTLFVACLRSQPRHRLFVSETATRDEPIQARSLIGSHGHHQIEATAVASLVQQRDVVHHHLDAVSAGSTVLSLAHRKDRGVNDGVEAGTCRVVGEHDRRQCRTVEPSFDHHSIAELTSDVDERSRARLYRSAREHIVIDDTRTELRKAR